MLYRLKLRKRVDTFFILTAIVLLTPYVIYCTGNNYFKLIEDIAYLIVFLYAIYTMLINNRVIVTKNIIMVIFSILFFLFMVIGIYYNNISIIILQIREFKYLLLLLIMIPYKSEENYDNIWKLLKIVAALNAPAAIIQRFLLDKRGDRITGIFGQGASGTLTLFLLIVFFVELCIRLQNNKRIIGFYFLILIPTILNETKITILLFPIMLFAALIITKRLKSKKTILVLIIVSIFFAVWFYAYEKIYSKTITDLFSSDYIENYLYSTDWVGDAGRFAKVTYAFNIIKNSNLLFGFGLGSSYIGASSGVSGYIADMYYTRAMFEGTKPQLFLSLFDFGLLGTILILLIMIYYFIRILKVRNNSTEKFISINSFIVIFVAFIYQNIFYTYQIMYIFLLYTILCYRNSICLTEKDI